MKKNFIWSMLAAVMVAMLSVSFASCSSNEDNEILSGTTINKEDLLGSWVLIHSEGWQMSDDEKNTFDYTFDPLRRYFRNGNKNSIYRSFSRHVQDDGI